ncbi:MAG TPA: permease prefix domain 1-containing protein, partial [Vicinamibacterales bacterium]|nr:permease prefix domain 1-containing protein [Vicinamibacterales bacterium]
MAWYHEITSSLVSLFRRRHHDAEMEEEMRFHLEMEAQRRVERGMSERDAKLSARRDFGGV